MLHNTEIGRSLQPQHPHSPTLLEQLQKNQKTPNLNQMNVMTMYHLIDSDSDSITRFFSLFFKNVSGFFFSMANNFFNGFFFDVSLDRRLQWYIWFTVLFPTSKHYWRCASTKVIKLVKIFMILVGFELRTFLSRKRITCSIWVCFV